MSPRTQSLIIVTVSVAMGALLAFFGGRWLEDRRADAGAANVVSTPTKRELGTLVQDPSDELVPVARTPDAGRGQDASLAVESASGCGQPPPFVGAGVLGGGSALQQANLPAYIPARYAPDHRSIVLMVFHDDATDADDFLPATGFVEIADELGIVLLAPQDPRVMAWTSKADAQIARTALQTAYDTLCVDPTRFYAVGFGAGGRVVEELPCIMEIAGIATASYRSNVDEDTCVPPSPVPYLHLAPTKDGYSPVEGGQGCGGFHEPISLAEKEARWRQRNQCKGARQKYLERDGSVCWQWACAEPFVSCHVDGGRRWPGTARRVLDIKKCDGPTANLPFAETIWQFFAKTTGKTPP